MPLLQNDNMESESRANFINRENDFMNNYQRECIGRLGNSIQQEQEAYLDQHPEVKFTIYYLETRVYDKYNLV